uniref:cardiolipin synthase (CMP-forming) n=1 Tax=Wuchereria bancrofti TaxID=6293 RepID=A0A1I8F1H0_WUCBA
MFGRIWLQNLMQCRKALSLVTYPIAYASRARSSKTCTSKHVTEVKMNENRNKPGNKIATIPNALCLFRIGMTPVIGYLIIKESYMIALALFAVSGITDWLDGYIARSFWSQSSLVGSIIDPVADKLLVTTVFIMPLTILVILRDVGLIAGGAVTRYKTLEKPVTLVRYFSPSVSPLQVTPTSISEYGTSDVYNRWKPGISYIRLYESPFSNTYLLCYCRNNDLFWVPVRKADQNEASKERIIRENEIRFIVINIRSEPGMLLVHKLNFTGDNVRILYCLTTLHGKTNFETNKWSKPKRDTLMEGNK